MAPPELLMPLLQNKPVNTPIITEFTLVEPVKGKR